MSPSLHNANTISSGKVCSLQDDETGGAAQNADMGKERDHNHLKAWREYRKLTQEQLADAVGTTKAVISLLESGDRQLSSKWLRKLAPAMNTRPGFLLDFDPDDVDGELLEATLSVPEKDKVQALQILKTFRNAG